MFCVSAERDYSVNVRICPQQPFECLSVHYLNLAHDFSHQASLAPGRQLFTEPLYPEPP